MKFVFVSVILLMLIPTSFAFGSHIIDDMDAFAQYLDITQISSEKYVLTINDKTYDIHYGYHGSFEVNLEKSEEYPKLSSMEIVPERKSIQITMESVPSTSIFWLRLPLDVISAEGAQYKLTIDGVDTPYDLIKYPDNYALGMMLPKDAKNVEIIGTYVVPEFGMLPIMILGIVLVGTVYLARKSSFGSRFQ
ncbi:MAG: PEFG-CTERM sorting domain-containing protein [Nitrosarchaeum sp.]|jgi:predicted secreted protein with PEFG-CTERM motif|uniref:PEFG-CTERM sorting domain-containing protein n=1 Tax=Nitrosarchaeum sp. TaxID=2026886 RepID=UPI002DEBB9F5|nr:PEFG-CTERM sorting domain-containing protein [Nitrosarchaeum sp.]